MIILVTTRFHTNTLRSLARGDFGVPTPTVRVMTYDRLFRAWRVPVATYIFGDLDRLTPWELRYAAALHRAMQAAGLRCLNDPARTMSRVELLTTLHSSGFNPFGVWRADEEPKPQRFPVFIRSESGHQKPSAQLYHDSRELAAGLAAQQDEGISLRGLLVIELAAAPYREGLWAKWGTWRIGDHYVVEHIAVDDTWLVKTGDHAKVTAEIAADEHRAVDSNDHAVAAAFDLGHIAFGRADHGFFAGRPVVFEINTNPYIGPYVPDSNPLRRQTQLLARSRIAAALAAVDTTAGGQVRLPDAQKRRPLRWWRLGFAPPRRP